MNKNFSVKNGIEIGVADGTAPITTTSTTKVVNLNSDKLDDQEGSYYLDWTNTTNKPDPVVTVTLTGDVIGTANTTLTDLGNGTVSVATTIAANSVALGTDTTGNYVVDVTAGTYITKSGTAGAGWSPTINVDATSANTVSKVVARDSSGNFSAGTITAALSGNASTSTKLATARNIALSGDITGSVDFDGSQNVSITATIGASAVNLTTDVAGALPAANGGTGQTSYTKGDILYASSSSALSKLADVATGNVLISGGVGVAPAYGKVGLTTHVTGTLPVANGGTGQTGYTIGDILYASSSSALSKLPAGTAGYVLQANGAGVAPAWAVAQAGASNLDALTDVIISTPSNDQVLTYNGTNWVNTTAPASGATITNDITTNAVQYLGMSRINTGAWTTAYTADTKLYFNPSSGTLNSTNFNSLSDENFKENIYTIPDSLNIIKSLNGVGFNWKDNGIKSYGVIAQELEKIIPELVSESNGVKSVNYDGIIGFLINAVKELSEKVELLEKK